METSTNEWNSAYWIDHLAKITDEKSLIPEKSNDSSNTTSPSVSNSLKTGLLIDVSDPSSPPVTKEVSIKFSGLETNDDEQPVGEPDISFSQMRAHTPKKTVVVETEQINCSLTDLVLGMKSTVIRDAYSCMDDQIRRSAYVADTVTFASLVEEAKQQKKTVFNVNAFEFKPSYQY